MKVKLYYSFIVSCTLHHVSIYLLLCGIKELKSKAQLQTTQSKDQVKGVIEMHSIIGIHKLAVEKHSTPNH